MSNALVILKYICLQLLTCRQKLWLEILCCSHTHSKCHCLPSLACWGQYHIFSLTVPMNKKRGLNVTTYGYVLSGSWNSQCSSQWRPRQERRRFHPTLSSASGTSSPLTSRTTGRRRTKPFWRRGTASCSHLLLLECFISFFFLYLQWHFTFTSSIPKQRNLMAQNKHLQKSIEMSLSKTHDLVTQVNYRPCCEHFNLETIFFVLDYSVSTNNRKHVSNHGWQTCVRDRARCKHYWRPLQCNASYLC